MDRLGGPGPRVPEVDGHGTGGAVSATLAPREDLARGGVDESVEEVDEHGELRSALETLAVLPIALPDAYRHPEILIQLLRPVPRGLRLADGAITVINTFPRTRSLEATAAVAVTLIREALDTIKEIGGDSRGETDSLPRR